MDRCSVQNGLKDGAPGGVDSWRQQARGCLQGGRIRQLLQLRQQRAVPRLLAAQHAQEGGEAQPPAQAAAGKGLQWYARYKADA